LFSEEIQIESIDVKTVNKVIYGIFGVLALLYGVAALISPPLVAGNSARSFPLSHLIREQGAAGIFIGLMAFWCVVNYEQRRSVHYFLMAFAFLLAVIHWLDYFAGHIGWMSPVYNSIPFMILLVMAALSRRLSGSTDPSIPS
jgi:predicted ferric reductase